MTNVFIIHGSYGSPEKNWFLWLKSELERLGCKVFIPKFPTPKNQSLQNWLNVFQKYEKYLDENSILVGHSVGSAFLLNLLEKKDISCRATFFVSGFTGSLNNPLFDKVNSSFTAKSFYWQRIRGNCSKFFVFHSDNDPYVPLQKAKDLAKNLGVDVILVKNAGHFNESAGYTKFDLLLRKIKDELSSLR